MNIADLIKYITFLKERWETIRRKVNEVSTTKQVQKVISSAVATQIVEQTEFVLSPKELMAEFDKNSKELRLAQQTLERINHTTDTWFKSKY